MKVPLNWLNEFVPVKDDIDELKKTLTAIGLEAETFTLEKLDFENVVIGKIASRKNAPGNRGFIHEVEVGGAFPGGKVEIFSTIPDIETGRKYPVALPGGHVGDLEITERPYEGFTSQGKFCCSTELGLTKLLFVENADGSVEWEDKLTDENGKPLSIFPDCEELPIGTDLAKWLTDEKVLEIELTSNRADCHSMIGVAREMTVVNGSYIKYPDLFSNFQEVPEQAEDITIRIEDKKGCMVYAGLIIDDIKIGPSPLWLAKKLFSAGMRPISNMVDITNLVLYEFGQPLHAFDHSLLTGATIIVRRAKSGEEMTTIDNVVRNLTPDDLVIADSAHPVAIAGVMGGFASEVTGKTKKILIESAWFDPVSVRRTSRRLNLKTEAAIRFERGVDPNGIVRAVHRTARLVKDLKCGKPASEIVVARAFEEDEIVIKLHENQIEKVLGEEIPTGQVEMILDGLGFRMEGSAPEWEVHVPSFRRDIFIAEDLIEEIARHIGYDNLPEGLPMTHMRSNLLDTNLRIRREIKGLLAGFGLWELNSFPFGTEDKVCKPNPLVPGGKPAKLMNPLTEDAGCLRMSLIPNIVDTYIRNLKRGANIYDVFEIGTVYWFDDDFREHRELIIGCLGDRAGKKSLRTHEKDFLKLKGYVESLLGSVGIRDYDIVSDESAPSDIIRYRVIRGDEILGYLDTIPEQSLAGETFERAVFTAYFPWDFISDSYVAVQTMLEFKPLPQYPTAERDLAFVLDESIPFRSMLKAIREKGGEWLENVEIFDVYRGGTVGENRKNIAVHLRFRNPSRTLTDEEIDERMNEIVSLVAERTGGTLRDW